MIIKPCERDFMNEVIEESVTYLSRETITSLDTLRPGDDVALHLVEFFRRHIVMNSGFLFLYQPVAILSDAEAKAMRISNKKYLGDFKSGLSKELWKLVRRDCIRPEIPLGDLTVLVVALFDGLCLQIVHDPAMIDDEDLWQSAKECLRPLFGLEQAAG